MAPRKKRYALIWWIDSAYKDVVDLLALPRGNREVDCVASLKWQDHKTKKMTKAHAKVLVISENRDELENIIVDDYGMINNASNKIFSAGILQERNEIAQQKKIRKSIKQSNNRQIDEKIRKERPLFGKENKFSYPESPKETICVPSTSSTSTSHDKDMSDVLSRKTRHGFHDITNPQLCSENKRHQRTEDTIEKTETFISRPCSFGTYWNMGMKTNNDKSDDGNISKNLDVSEVAQRDMQTYNSNVSSQCVVNLQNPLEVGKKNIQEIPQINPTEKQENRHEEKEYTSQKKRNISDDSSDSEECSTQNSEDSSLDSFDEFQIERKRNFDSAARSFAGLIPFKVTKRDIEFQNFLLAAMKHSYEYEAKTDVNNIETFQLPTHMFNSADGMVEISSHSGFYLPRQKVAYIEFKATKGTNEYDWKILVRETLLEIYGESITNYSATGKRTRPAINAVLFKALFGWVTEKTGKSITRKEFIQCINKCASNKRKYREKKRHGTKYYVKRQRT